MTDSTIFIRHKISEPDWLQIEINKYKSIINRCNRRLNIISFLKEKYPETEIHNNEIYYNKKFFELDNLHGKIKGHFLFVLCKLEKFTIPIFKKRIFYFNSNEKLFILKDYTYESLLTILQQGHNFPDYLMVKIKNLLEVKFKKCSFQKILRKVAKERFSVFAQELSVCSENLGKKPLVSLTIDNNNSQFLKKLPELTKILNLACFDEELIPRILGNDETLHIKWMHDSDVITE